MSRTIPTATYRLQINGGFTFDDAAGAVPYLARLGVSHLYLSPLAQPVPESNHGYDVIDHDAVWAEAGGRAGLERLAAAARTHGLGLVLDIVPNHMAVPGRTRTSPAVWSLLAEGQDSPYAGWFDVDWAAGGGRLVLPLLGRPLAEALAAGAVAVVDEPDGPVLRVDWAEYPVRPGTAHLPVADLLEAQHYRLTDGSDDPLNYRRFFEVPTLAGLRVEDPDVFDAVHRLPVELVRAGLVDGLRIDHPDGLVDPEGYLERLAEATGGVWTVVEKILEPGEELPPWRCDGTTGYDALLRVQQVLTPSDPDEVLDRLWAERAPESTDFAAVVAAAKRQVVTDLFGPEVDRLVRLATVAVPGSDPAALRAVVVELLVAVDRYRAYVRPGGVAAGVDREVLDHAEQVAGAALNPAHRDQLRSVAALTRGDADGSAAAEFAVRFQQTTGPVMAKGVEDTALYRFHRLAGANEVGGDPARPSIAVGEFHAWCSHQLATWPHTMTTSSTHDAKRGEDVRARSMVIAADPRGWADWVAEAERLGGAHRPATLDRPTEYLVWQTLVTARPLTAPRLADYLRKALREAKQATSWLSPDEAYEGAVLGYATALLADPRVGGHVAAWAQGHAAAERTAVLAAKLLTLTIPGIPDLYQGSEVLLTALVDPDNRGPVDFARPDETLTALDVEKRELCRAALRLRREHPDWFTGARATYVPLDAGPGAVAFGRGAGEVQVVVIAARPGTAPARVRVALPAGAWRDLLSGAPFAGLPASGVALLVRG
ncbi:MAG: malto-oligosyltrehalose synthase [Micropruina sp.]|nr:MAG: malto-oligosyltrehalose synthase [Micropruina sp.]